MGKKDEEKAKLSGSVALFGDGPPVPPTLEDPARREVAVAVVEQRVSNLAQGSMCLILLTGPFMHILGLIPRGMCVGAFRWGPFDTKIIHESSSGVLGGLLWVIHCVDED